MPAPVLPNIAVHDDRAGASDVDGMGMSWNVVVLLRQILYGESIDNGVTAQPRVEINHAPMGRPPF